jgi:Recombinase
LRRGTKAALAEAKRRSTKLDGNRHGQNWNKVVKLGARASVQVRQAKAGERSADMLAIIQDLPGGKDWTLQQIADALNQRGFETARGGQWSATEVMRVLQSRGGE